MPDRTIRLRKRGTGEGAEMPDLRKTAGRPLPPLLLETLRRSRPPPLVHRRTPFRSWRTETSAEEDEAREA